MIVSNWSTVQVHYNRKCFFEIGTPFYKAFTVCLQIELTLLYL